MLYNVVEHSWLRHCATSRKIAFSIPDGIIGLFQWHNPSLESNQHNRNEYQYFLAGQGGRCLGLTTLPPSCDDCLEIWEPHPPGNHRTCPGLYRDCFALYTGVKRIILAPTRAVGKDSTLNLFGDVVFETVEGENTSEQITNIFIF